MLRSISLFDNNEAYFHFSSESNDSFFSTKVKVFCDKETPWLAESQPGQLEDILDGFGISLAGLPNCTYGQHSCGEDRFTLPAKYLSACLSLSQPDSLPYEMFLDDWEKAFEPLEPVQPAKPLSGVHLALGKYAYPADYKVPEYYDGHVWSLVASGMEHSGHLTYDLTPELTDKTIGIIITTRPAPTGAAKNRPYTKLVQRL